MSMQSVMSRNLVYKIQKIKTQKNYGTMPYDINFDKMKHMIKYKRKIVKYMNTLEMRLINKLKLFLQLQIFF